MDRFCHGDNIQPYNAQNWAVQEGQYSINTPTKLSNQQIRLVMSE